MKHSMKLACAAASLALCCAAASADGLPYKAGPVVVVTSIKIKEGHFFDYWTFLRTQWREENEAAKKAGIVLSYEVLSAQPKTPNEADLYLVITYPNYAALDNLDEKMSAIDEKLWGSLKQAAKEDADRNSIRTVLGSETLQVYGFKE